MWNMNTPRGPLSPLLNVFIPIFADDWNQLSTVAIAYFPLSGWWMWSHLSDCAGVPTSSDNEGLSICAMNRTHQKGWIEPCRDAVTNPSLLLPLFRTGVWSVVLYMSHAYTDGVTPGVWPDKHDVFNLLLFREHHPSVTGDRTQLSWVESLFHVTASRSSGSRHVHAHVPCVGDDLRYCQEVYFI